MNYLEEIKSELDKNGINQVDFMRFGFSKSHVSMILKGTRSMDLKFAVIVEILTGANITAHWIMMQETQSKYDLNYNLTLERCSEKVTAYQQELTEKLKALDPYLRQK